MSIGVAIIGSGIFAKENHLPAILGVTTLTLKAIYSRSLKSAQALTSSLPAAAKDSVKLYSDDSPSSTYSDLLTNPGIHAIVIALPILSQPKYIKEALKAGKHVLSEKPIAGDVKTAKELVQWYKSSGEVDKSVMWGVAENFRYMEKYVEAGKEVQKLGRVLGFRVRMNALVKEGSKYYETEWRKTPEYQGGFLLDGGIHFIAGIREMLGPENDIARVSAFTGQLQKHLLPIDTMNATCMTKTGVSGTIAVSFGTTFKGAGWEVACEKGSVSVNGDDVVVDRDGEESKQTYGPKEGFGVPEEIEGWSRGLQAGKLEERQGVDEALKDLLVLEAIFKSGEQNGAPLDTGV